MENIKNEIITSLEIAQLLKKQHSDVLRDLRDETTKLGEELAAKDFTLVIYKDANHENLPLYKLTKIGALIFAERYEAHTKKILIDKINDLTIDETISKTETVQDKVENEVKSEENDTFVEENEKILTRKEELKQEYENFKKEKALKFEDTYETRRILYEIEKLDIKLQIKELDIKMILDNKNQLLEKYEEIKSLTEKELAKKSFDKKKATVTKPVVVTPTENNDIEISDEIRNKLKELSKINREGDLNGNK